MCVTAIVQNSTTQYTLSGTGKTTPGWMGVGFGSHMANSPMVILWSNSDGLVTLSQRQAPAEVMPTVVSSPPRTATLLMNASTTSGNSPQFVFSIPSANTTTIPTIWAFGPQNPGSSSPSAPLRIHEETGTASFDLSKDFTGVATASRSSALLPFQRLVIGHASMLTIGFLFLLPIGALLARYMRTFTPIWFKGHWIVQFAISGPIIVIGVALGIQAVIESGGQHLNDEHKNWGVALFVLYFFQCSLGAFIHWVKFKNILGAALYQVRTGYKTEWPKIGRGPLMAGADYVWYIWVVLLPLLYAIGLAYLPKQFNQENKNNLKQETYGEFFEATAFNDHKRGEERAMGSPSFEMAEEHHAMMVEEAKPTELYND
ncbi:CBD9-like protein [Lentinula edodes]|uniref:CBD9-like protein n=1 Tax=Lentinula edodes TaxID=5353 RepID=A0A1Q3EIJ0_LENED|nr:CBD9-like protein [Lentinula edodes]